METEHQKLKTGDITEMDKNFEKLLAVAIIGILFALVVAGIKEFSAAPYTVYVTANDGGYLPITYYPCEVVSTSGSELTVNHDGELYSCYVGEDPYIIGEVVWCGFSSYEGELELVDIK